MKKSKTIVVTGCGGFIGSHFTRKCLELGYNIIGVDKMTYASNANIVNEFLKNEKFKFLRKDINDVKLNNYNYDLIVNFAAETHVDNSIDDCSDFIHSNISGVHNLINQSKTNKTPFIQISTDEVFGDIQEGSHKETDKLNPSNPYSATKSSADLLIKSYARTYGLEYQIIRLTNNYGLDQHKEKLIPKVIDCIQNNKKIPIHNQGTPFRNWLFVGDSIEAILTVINKGKINEIYNVNGNCELQNIEVVKTILRYFEFTEDYNINDYCDFGYKRAGQDVRYSLDDSKLRSLGWKPEAVFEDKLWEIINHSTEILGYPI